MNPIAKSRDSLVAENDGLRRERAALRCALLSARVALMYPEAPPETTRRRVMREINEALGDHVDRLFSVAERFDNRDADADS